MWKEIFTFIAGGICGYFLDHFLDFLKNKLLNSKKNSTLRDLLKTYNPSLYVSNDGYMPLEHGYPFFDNKRITIKNSDTLFIISIPKEYHDFFREHDFEIREESLNVNGKRLSYFFNQIGLMEFEKLLNETRHKVAQDFINEINEGYIRFNGFLFGIENLFTGRITGDEITDIKIRLYTTDYYTYRVFANIYQSLKNKNKIQIEGLSNLKKLTPFFSSFGIGVFLLYNKGYGLEVLIPRRSNNVVVDKNKIHFSMNEAFSLKDINEFDTPSLLCCLTRGLKEELGISEEFITKYLVEYNFLDLYIETERFEMGISGYVKIELDENFTFDTLMGLINIAQDKEFETTNFMSINVKNLDNFLNNNWDEMSIECRSSLRNLNARIKAGFIS